MMKTLKTWSLFLLFLLMPMTLVAQNEGLSVKRFEDVSTIKQYARTQPRTDANGEYAALVLVQVLTDVKIDFTGAYLLGNVEKKASEYWVYMAAGAKSLEIHCTGFEKLNVVFGDVSQDAIPSLKAKCTYELVINVPTVLPGNIQEMIAKEFEKYMHSSTANHNTPVLNTEPEVTKPIEKQPQEESVDQKNPPLSKYQPRSQYAKQKTLLMGQLGYSVAPQLSYGAMFGQMYNGCGWYVNARSNFQFGHSAVASCDADGLVDGVRPFYSGKTSSSHLAIHAGYMMNVLEKVTKNKFHTLGFYLGAGYGQRELLAETNDGEWIKYAPTSHAGFAGNVGLFGSVAGVTLNVGVSTINFSYLDLEVGIGFMF